MTPTQNKDTNINFRVTEQRKLKLQKKGIIKKMTLSDLLNKIIEKHHEPIIKKAIPQVAKSEDGEKLDKKTIYILIIVVGFISSIWIIVSPKKKNSNIHDWRNSRSDLPSQNNM